jgi:hypothetical protein
VELRDRSDFRPHCSFSSLALLAVSTSPVGSVQPLSQLSWSKPLLLHWQLSGVESCFCMPPERRESFFRMEKKGSGKRWSKLRLGTSFYHIVPRLCFFTSSVTARKELPSLHGQNIWVEKAHLLRLFVLCDILVTFLFCGILLNT